MSCLNFTFTWPCIVTNFFIIKPTRCTSFSNLPRHETLHVQAFIHCTFGPGICHTGLKTAFEQDYPRVVYYVYGRFVYNMSCLISTFMWLCIVTNFFIIKPTRCTNFPNSPWHKTTCFGQFLCPLSGVYPLYTWHWYMSYSMTYTIAECTVNKLLMMGRGTARNM